MHLAIGTDCPFGPHKVTPATGQSKFHGANFDSGRPNPSLPTIVARTATAATRGEVPGSATLDGTHETPREIVPEGVLRPQGAGGPPSTVFAPSGTTIAGPASRVDTAGRTAPIAATAPPMAATSPHGLDCGTLTPSGDPGPSLLDLLDATPMARATDPDTAHHAAWSAANTDHRAVYVAILAAVHEHGPLTDYHLSLHVARRTGTPILRTSVGKRRGELRDMGLMADSGHRAKTDTNSTAIRWAITAAGEHALLARSAA